MPIVTYTYSGPESGVLVLELLAKVQDTELAVNSAGDGKPTLKVVTTNPIVKSSTSSSFESWLDCVKEISGAIPSLRLWDENLEQWIVSSSAILVSDSEKPVVDFVSQLEGHLNKNPDNKYLMGEFSAGDVCVSIWCASAMIKFGVVSEAQKPVYEWVSKTLKSLVSYDESKVSKLLSDLELGVTSNLVGNLNVSDDKPKSILPDNACTKKLEEFGLEFEVYVHETCMTADELVEKVPLSSEKNETHTKNLFFQRQETRSLFGYAFGIIHF
jgi:hypothetical protein